MSVKIGILIIVILLLLIPSINASIAYTNPDQGITLSSRDYLINMTFRDYFKVHLIVYPMMMKGTTLYFVGDREYKYPYYIPYGLSRVYFSVFRDNRLVYSDYYSGFTSSENKYDIQIFEPGEYMINVTGRYANFNLTRDWMWLR